MAFQSCCPKFYTEAGPPGNSPLVALGQWQGRDCSKHESTTFTGSQSDHSRPATCSIYRKPNKTLGQFHEAGHRSPQDAASLTDVPTCPIWALEFETRTISIGLEYSTEDKGEKMPTLLVTYRLHGEYKTKLTDSCDLWSSHVHCHT